MTLRVALDISSGLAHSAGVSRYALELAKELKLREQDGAIALRLFHNLQPLTNLPKTLAAIPRTFAPLSNKTWRAFLLSGVSPPPSWLPIKNTDIFHGLDVITPPLNIPTVITLHDLTTVLFPKFHSKFNAVYQKLALPVMVRRADRIIADSMSTRRDAISLLKIPEDRIEVVHLGVNHDVFYPRPDALEVVRQNLGNIDKYILGVGTLEPRKNLLALLQACCALEDEAPTLVLAGAKGWGRSELFKQVERLGLTKKVIFTGFVSEDLLANLYSAASMFVYPSYYEGFGLPVLEAMACGAPVICSNTSSLPEVVGEAAILISPDDIGAIAQAIRLFINDKEMTAKMRARSLEQAAKFTWQRTADETICVYHKVIDK
ncbi:MAG TPA: glycosyltransferase family 1 protein [Thermoflexales bacterium]|nr:glycosyltransferase family 1 protein [Thermoflexales bacterium]HQZ99772.1 glycosyltransferase family 1 protein [Thermoflexales bacterium]